MRCRLAVLMLFAVLPGMNVWAAPAPAPSAILQIAPPPKGETEEQYRKDQIEGQSSHALLGMVLSDPEVKKLLSYDRLKNGRPWLTENLRVTEEKGGRYLRFTFRAGTHAEQVAILNAFLRANLAMEEWGIKASEESLRGCEKNVIDLERRVKLFSQNPQEVASCREAIDYLRSATIPSYHAEIARCKQFVVIRWAK